MPNHVDDALLHAMPDSELSRVRTELNQLRIIPTVAPHPVQPNPEFPGHRYLGNAFLSTHRQVHIPTPPVRIRTHRCLRCFSQQVAQQRVALLADVSQSLPASTGVLTGNQPNVAADLLAAREPFRRPNDQNVHQPGDGSHPRVGSSTAAPRAVAGLLAPLLPLTPLPLDPAGPAAPIILSGADWPTEPTRVSRAGLVPVRGTVFSSSDSPRS